MILAIDIGNTNIVLGCIDEKQTYFMERLSTNKTKTEAEYANDIKTILEIHEVQASEIEGTIVSSVVPQITKVVKRAAEKIVKSEAMVVGPGVKTGVNILIDNPSQLGSDRVVNAVAAVDKYPAPMIIFDLGTANTACVIDAKKNYIGGMIFPGIITSLNALTANAAQLQGISLEEPKRVIGRNTIDCMKSGIIYSNAASLDGIIDRIEEELGMKTTVIATGGLSKVVVPFCKKEIILDDDLLIEGLLRIYNKNK